MFPLSQQLTVYEKSIYQTLRNIFKLIEIPNYRLSRIK